MLVVNLISPDRRYDELYLSNYATISVKDDLRGWRAWATYLPRPARLQHAALAEPGQAGRRI